MGNWISYIYILGYRNCILTQQLMGSIIMKKQTTFKNLVMPKIKGTKPRVPINVPEKGTKIKSYLNEKVKDTDKFSLYHFGSKKALPKQECGIYELPEQLSVLTYNIWFDQHNKEVRFECILKMLQMSNCDFICLQEVTQDFVKLLHALPTDGWIKDYYTGIIPMGWYDTVILTKFKCRFFKPLFENSFMGRSMLFAEMIEAKGRNIIVGCMHYESLQGNQKLREEQVMAVQDITKQCDRVIIVGDYNFSDYSGESKIIDKSFVDLWVHLHKICEDRYTMPQTTKYAPWRPDHIICKIPTNFDSAQIFKIGEFTVPPFENQKLTQVGKDDIVRSPSDHFGLISWIPIK